MLVLFFPIFLLNFGFIFCNKCCSINLRAPARFTLVKFNARSFKNVIARKEVASVEKCKEFAESKKGLAFNFGRENFTESELQKFENLITSLKFYILVVNNL